MDIVLTLVKTAEKPKTCFWKTLLKVLFLGEKNPIL